MVRSDTKEENVSGIHDGLMIGTSQVRNAGKADGLPKSQWLLMLPRTTIRYPL